MAENRPNYFPLLGIDPDEPWDQVSFPQRLRVKRAYWSGLISNGVKDSKPVIEAQRAMNLLADIERVMSDPVARDRERAAARAQQARDEARRNADFEQTLKIMLAKGFLYDTEIATLRRDHDKLVDTPDVSERLARVSVLPFAAQSPLPERLDPTRTATVRRLLDSLAEKSLYTLLARTDPDVDASAPIDVLQRAARRLYKWTQSQADKTQLGLTAKQELAGHAMVVFATAQERARYDNTLALARVDDLLRRYQSALTPVKRFESGQAEQFLRDAGKAGAEPGVARALLLKYFTDLKWTVVLPADGDGGAPGNLVRCGACRALNDPGEDFCRHCGAQFQATCPKCERVGPGYGSCGHCGFPVGDQRWVRVLLDDCEELLRQPDLVQAGQLLKKIDSAWPLPPTSTDELAVRHRQYAERYELLRGERDKADRELSQRLHELMGDRQFLAAYRMATTASETVPGREQVLRQSDERIREADRLYDRAQRPGASGPEKASCYEKALAVCADHEKSQQALRLLPPERPEELRVVVAENAVRLTWQPSSTSDVRYVVVRKRGTPPASAVDGSRIATLTQLSYDDVAPEFGVPLHYGVFADRAGTASLQGSTTTDPVFLTGEVTVTSRSVDDSAVVLEWALPPHCLGVSIQRSDDLTPEPTEVVATGPNRLHDQGLRNGVAYTYTLYARYQDIQSTGTSVTLTPDKPPAPPGAVHVRTVDQTLGISYRHVDLLPDTAERDTVGVLWSDLRPTVRHGDRIDVADLAQHGTLLTGTAARGHALFSSGLYYFTPVAIHHELAYVGEPRRYAAVAEVSDLTATNHGDRIRLQWTWPDGCDTALVAHGHTDWPADPTAAHDPVLVERAEYDRDGWYDLRVDGQSGEREYFLVVAAAVRRTGEVFVSSGVRCRATLRQHVQLEYEVTSTRRHNRLQIHVTAPVRLPALVVVGNPDNPPANRDDGQILYEQDATRVRRTHTITVPTQGKQLFAGLFLRADDDLDVHVVPPSSPDDLLLS